MASLKSRSGICGALVFSLKQPTILILYPGMAKTRNGKALKYNSFAHMSTAWLQRCKVALTIFRYPFLLLLVGGTIMSVACMKSHDPNENFLDGVSVKNNIIDALKLLRSGMMGDAYTINVVTKTSDSRFQI